MTVLELIASLRRMPPDYQVMILDGFNGGGAPRDINLGPTIDRIMPRHTEDAADCEGRVGELVVVLGYGCY